MFHFTTAASQPPGQKSLEDKVYSVQGRSYCKLIHLMLVIHCTHECLSVYLYLLSRMPGGDYQV